MVGKGYTCVDRKMQYKDGMQSPRSAVYGASDMQLFVHNMHSNPTGTTKWTENLLLDHLHWKPPFLLQLKHRCPFTRTHLPLSSSCAKLILSEALTLSWSTMSGGAVEKGAPCAALCSALFGVSTPLVKSLQP